MTAVPEQLNPFFETMITTESLHKLANLRNTKENLQIKRYYSNCLFTAATIDSIYFKLLSSYIWYYNVNMCHRIPTVLYH